MIHNSNLTAELCRNGVMIDPFWHMAVVEYLLYGYKQCVSTNSIVYQNNVLGWYPFNGEKYYFYDETQFDGKTSLTTRNSIEFKKGDEMTYRKFLQDTVFPSTELSLALAIGYSAVVVSRLNDEQDLRNSYC
jgi:spore germination protein YaaH